MLLFRMSLVCTLLFLACQFCTNMELGHDLLMCAHRCSLQEYCAVRRCCQTEEGAAQNKTCFAVRIVWLNRSSLMAIYHVSPVSSTDVDKMTQDVPCLYNWHGQRCDKHGFRNKTTHLPGTPENRFLSNSMLHYMMSQIDLVSKFKEDTVLKTIQQKNILRYYKHRHSSTDYHVGCARNLGSQITSCSVREWTSYDETVTSRPIWNSGCRCHLPETGEGNDDRFFVKSSKNTISVYDNVRKYFVTLGDFTSSSIFTLLAFDAENCVIVTYKYEMGDDDYEEDSETDIKLIQLFCTDGTHQRDLATGTLCGMFYDRHRNFVYYIEQVKDVFEMKAMDIAGNEPIVIATLAHCHCPRDLNLVAGDPATKSIVWVSFYDNDKSKVSYAAYSGSQPVNPILVYEVDSELSQLSVTGDLLLWIGRADLMLRSYNLTSKVRNFVTKCPGPIPYDRPFTDIYKKGFTLTCVVKSGNNNYRSRTTMYDMHGTEVGAIVAPCWCNAHVG